ncbi:Histone-Lysine N-Methyltransferase ash1l [Nowakowskiella sp. JEL0078]|nr:Histone-Lysine N-Methyltransferase ash1l [Nowakowskiella sp. JEL0078]
MESNQQQLGTIINSLVIPDRITNHENREYSSDIDPANEVTNYKIKEIQKPKLENWFLNVNQHSASFKDPEVPTEDELSTSQFDDEAGGLILVKGIETSSSTSIKPAGYKSMEEFYSCHVPQDIPMGSPRKQISFFFNSNPLPEKYLDEIEPEAYPFWKMHLTGTLKFFPPEVFGHDELDEFGMGDEEEFSLLNDYEMEDIESNNGEYQHYYVYEDIDPDYKPSLDLAMFSSDSQEVASSSNIATENSEYLFNGRGGSSSEINGSIQSHSHQTFWNSPDDVPYQVSVISQMRSFFRSILPEEIVYQVSSLGDQFLAGEILKTSKLTKQTRLSSGISKRIKRQEPIVEKKNLKSNRRRKSSLRKFKRDLSDDTDDFGSQDFEPNDKTEIISRSQRSKLVSLNTKPAPKCWDDEFLVFGQTWRDCEAEWSEKQMDPLTTLYSKKRYLDVGMYARELKTGEPIIPRLTYIKSISSKDQTTFYGKNLFQREDNSGDDTIEAKDLVIVGNNEISSLSTNEFKFTTGENIADSKNENTEVRFKFVLPSDYGSVMLQTEIEFELPYDLLLYSNLMKLNPQQRELQWQLPTVREQPKKLPVFKHITSNIYVDRRPNKPTEVPICDCKPGHGDSEGCNEDCLNRCMFIECTPNRCPSGPLCKNQRFQKLETSPGLEVFWTLYRGYGLRTSKPIKSNALVIEYRGEIISHATCRERIQTIYANTESHYFLEYSAGEVIDGCRKGNVARFVNHSCEPNCHIEKWYVNGEFCVGLFASENIPEGTELTYDYRFEAFGKMQDCLCGSANCRGRIGVNKRDINKEKERLLNNQAEGPKKSKPNVSMSRKPRGAIANSLVSLQETTINEIKNVDDKGVLIDFWLAPKRNSNFKRPIRLIENEKPYSTTFSMIESMLGKTFREAVRNHGFTKDTKVFLNRNIRKRFALHVKFKKRKLSKWISFDRVLGIPKKVKRSVSSYKKKSSVHKSEEEIRKEIGGIVDKMWIKSVEDEEIQKLAELCGSDDDLSSISSDDESTSEMELGSNRTSLLRQFSSNVVRNVNLAPTSNSTVGKKILLQKNTQKNPEPIIHVLSDDEMMKNSRESFDITAVENHQSCERKPLNNRKTEQPHSSTSFRIKLTVRPQPEQTHSEDNNHASGETTNSRRNRLSNDEVIHSALPRKRKEVRNELNLVE